jgi:hypothetical protein
MKGLHNFLVVLLSIGVAAPLAARPRGAVAGRPGRSAELFNVAVAADALTVRPVVTAPVVGASLAAWPWNSEQPGSVLVFPKFIRGTINDLAVSGQVIHAVTELEISVMCPPATATAPAAVCTQGQPVTIRAHWVCASCVENSFDLHTTVGGTVYFNPEGVNAPGGVVLGETYPNNATTPIPVPPCLRGYLIAWVVDGGTGAAIKFDGLIGDAVIKEPTPGCNGPCVAKAYNAIPIQASENLSTGDATDVNGNGALDFDDTEYKAITGTVYGTVRYENLTPPDQVETDLTLLTLDAASNRPNVVTNVGFNFYTAGEDLFDTGLSFSCWTELRLTDISPSLTKQTMGRKGLMVSTYAQQNGAPVTLLGLVETKEFFGTIYNRSFMYSLLNDGLEVPTTFVP